VAEIGQVCGPNNQASPAVIGRNGKALSIPARVSAIESVGAPRQVRLPVEEAVREVARSVLDYIVTNRLTHDEGYQAFKAELVSIIPRTLLSINEMELIEKVSQDLLDKVATNTLSIAPAEIGPESLAQAGGRLTAVNASDTVEQILESISPPLAKASALAEAGWQQSEVGRDRSLETPTGQTPIGPEQRLVMSWTLGNSVTPRSDAAQNAKEGSIPGVLSAGGFLARPVDPNSPLAAANSLANGSEIVLTAQPSEDGQSSASNTLGSSSAAPVTAGATQQPEPGRPSAVSGRSPNSSDLLRVDLKEILSGRSAELRIRRDEALIMSKVAVLLEQMNGLVRVYEEQDRGASRSRQKPLLNVNLSLRQVLAAALGIVIEGNKAFSSPASIGVSTGRDGLLALDPTLLKNALESNRNEAVTVLKSMANSFYDNVGLYVDPRILVRFSELLGIDVAKKADRSRKEKERRWKKDKESLEKRFLELALLLEESGKLRNWLIKVVESLGHNGPDEDPSDEVSKRALPSVDLAWDQEEIVSVDGSPEELKESLVTLFVGCTTCALQEEDADAAIKLLLKRKSLSDKLLAVRPDLEPKVAMICLANEELIMGRIEAERQNLFKNLDELSRTTVAARGYRSQFPFPPPMAAFISSEG
jgi:hypothetical protein